MDRQQEIKKFLEEIQIKGIKNVIFPESFFFLSRCPNTDYSLDDQSEVFKDFHLFTQLIQDIISRDIKVHIQTNSLIQRKLDRLSIIEMLCDMSAICKRKMSESLMFYHSESVSQIASRLAHNIKPSFGIKVINYGVRKAKNLLSFNINYKNKSSHNSSVRPDEIVVVLNSSFSGAQREELFLGNFRVIELTIMPKKKQVITNSKRVAVNTVSGAPSAASKNSPNTRIVNNYQLSENKYQSAKNIYDQSYQIYNQLRDRSKEFSQSAVELKMKSDRQKEVLVNIDSMIAKDLSGMDASDFQDAKAQCKREIQIYDQQCKDFFDLYVQISEQAKEAKDDLIRAEIELKKYSTA